MEAAGVSELDKKIIRALQGEFPLVAEPYKELAAGIGISEDLFLQRVRAMEEDKKIRKMGAVLRHREVGFKANVLAAWVVPQEKLDELSEYVIPDNLVVLTSVAPFLSSDALCRLADRLDHITPDDFLVGMEGLLPFMGMEMMEKLHRKASCS